MHSTQTPNHRQRFYLQHSPVRGDIVQLTSAYQTAITQKPYPAALKALLGEMLAAACLLAATLKIDGSLSIQLQKSKNGLIDWAMAECDSSGQVRALADFNPSGWDDLHCADDALAQVDGVLFINIHSGKDSYQGIIERISNNLAACLMHYQKQSAQIPTFLTLATTEQTAAGLLVQQLPLTDAELAAQELTQLSADNGTDGGAQTNNQDDLWQRVQLLARTLKPAELTDLPINEILYRLYHEEAVAMGNCTPLHFGCTCSAEKSLSALVNLGRDEAMALFADGDAGNGGSQNKTIKLDCQFCGTVYGFDKQTVANLFQ